MKERAAAKTIVEAVSVLESISLAGVTMAVSSRGLGQHLCTGKLVWQSPLKKKKKGDQSTCSNYRGTILSSHPAKRQCYGQDGGQWISFRTMQVLHWLWNSGPAPYLYIAL